VVLLSLTGWRTEYFGTILCALHMKATNLFCNGKGHHANLPTESGSVQIVVLDK
jgi:hypothetical protein